ncbi:hypothetical protein Cha6605_2375 [Chamaesiphon minutus PCC 6605]|uniref:Uncharacterized protein n=1 Tax=Chamaesiphon minutus (strain ATCC 27169 / PCC 6605) TaxID=1173020 RepID=K9UFL6_CHAP6|nr:hypothetical protein Cha6605_2375 [Chamaesiphon minutus PCC 6605]
MCDLDVRQLTHRSMTFSTNAKRDPIPTNRPFGGVLGEAARSGRVPRPWKRDKTAGVPQRGGIWGEASPQIRVPQHQQLKTKH